MEPLLAATGGAPTLPLVVLFVFNLVDEFDRVAFGVLSPEIRDTFSLSDSGIVAIGSIAGVTSLIAALPIGVLADRLTRVRMAAVGAGIWGAFTVVTALSPVTWVLALARTVAGVGRIVNEPVHASLLTDYYAPVHHPKVFALHRLANPVGLASALVIGVLGALLDWRVVFAALCLPTFLLLPVLLRLREPARGESVDVHAARAAADAGAVSFGDARRQLFAVKTLRRVWLALPVLGIAILVLTQLTSLFFEREYGYGPTGRGVVTFLSGVGIVLGLGLGQRYASRALATGCPERLATSNGLAVVGVGLGVGGMVLSPSPYLSAVLNLVTGIAIGAYQPSYFSLVALVSPARIRAQAYAYSILFLGGGGLLAPTFASIGEHRGYRLSLGILAATIFAGGLVIMTATRSVRADAERATASLVGAPLAAATVPGPVAAATVTVPGHLPDVAVAAGGFAPEDPGVLPRPTVGGDRGRGPDGPAADASTRAAATAATATAPRQGRPCREDGCHRGRPHRGVHGADGHRAQGRTAEGDTAEGDGAEDPPQPATARKATARTTAPTATPSTATATGAAPPARRPRRPAVDAPEVTAPQAAAPTRPTRRRAAGSDSPAAESTQSLSAGRTAAPRVSEERAQQGVLFPTGEDGRRSTTSTGRAVLADALAAADPTAAERARAAKDWRSAYLEHVVTLTAAGAASREAAVAIARAGLDSAHGRLVFARDGAERPVLEAVAAPAAYALGTATVKGQGARQGELAVPYRGDVLRGDTLRRQLADWVAGGVVEQSCADAVGRVLDHPDWLDLSDRAVAVLGAGAEMGPVETLLGFGATVLAVDVPSPRVWSRVLRVAEAGAGTLLAPTRPGTSDPLQGGADLLEETPELAHWLATTAEGLPLTVGSYAYADGAAHVQVALAGDALVADLLRRRPDVSYAELATPTDAFVVPLEVVEDARARWTRRGWRAPLQTPARLLSRGSLYQPAYPTTVPGPGGEVGVADALVPQQGPNYALAKRIQRWRAVVAQDDGVLVSANVAPATRTRSVTKNRLLAAAYAGAGRFGVEVFAPETSRALMSALLVHDLRAPAEPVAHPDDLFVRSAAHGGLWRVPYQPRSVLGLAAVAGARHLVTG